MKLSDVRSDYSLAYLDEDTMPTNPFEAVTQWLNEAKAAGIRDFHAMTLATADTTGRVSARIVLLKELDERGFVFFTNYLSRKGSDMTQNPQVGLCFYWDTLERQINVCGRIEKTTRAESEAYFSSRPRQSQLGAWASRQSTVLEKGYAELTDNYKSYEAEYSGRPVPTPPHWGGYRLIPNEITFWQGRPSRLHDRICYLRQDGGWKKQRLSP